MDYTWLLLEIYRREEQQIQAGDWDNLRVPVTDLLTATTRPAEEILRALTALRLNGRILFLPDWREEETTLRRGSMVESEQMWEPVLAGPAAATWQHRQVYLPDDLATWSVRSRIAETIRLLSFNRERFGLEPTTIHVGYLLQERKRPEPDLPVKDVLARLDQLIEQGELARADRPDDLRLALEAVASAFPYPTFAGFQARSWEAVLRALFGRPQTHPGVILTAGVSSGKTFAFLLPLLTLLVYRRLSGEGRRVRALAVYPRTSLVVDQYHVLRDYLGRVNERLTAHGRPPLTDRPALDAAQLLGGSLGLAEDRQALRYALAAVEDFGIEVILTTQESLKNRMLDARAVETYLRHVELIIIDEIHLFEGLSGCHGIYFLRRLRQLVRRLRKDQDFQPALVGASATVAEPVEHAARVFSLPHEQVRHVAPLPEEMKSFSIFHHLFLHSRAGKPSFSVVTNGISCLVHNRNDGTAQTHYDDPSATEPRAIPSAQRDKTIVFVDALSTIGRLDFTTRDNEGCHDIRPDSRRPPYYAWFYRPAARLRASDAELKRIDQEVGRKGMEQVRRWCQDCHHGKPMAIDARLLQAKEFGYLCISRQMREKTIRETTVPGFERNLQHLSLRNEPVGNLDRCPFLRAGVCWWFSQDFGVQRSLSVLGDVPIHIDQNRPVQYTSRTDDLPQELPENVNDYFLRPARSLWFIRHREVPCTPEPVSTMFASPKIEVGVDFDNIRDGATHKALRNVSSFQQKIGRVGRESGSDCLLVTFLSQRSTDAHFAHFPQRLIDPDFLDPIALKEDNADVVRTHLFTATLEYLATQPGIAANGRHLNTIAPAPAADESDWQAKLAGCCEHIQANRTQVRDYLLTATGRPTADGPLAEEAIEQLLSLFELFLTDLTGVYVQGGTPARWFKENPTDGPDQSAAFRTLVAVREQLLAALRQLPASGVPEGMQECLGAIEAAVQAGDGNILVARGAELLTLIGPALASGLSAGAVAAVALVSQHATALASQLAALPGSEPIARLLEAHELVQAFFHQDALSRLGRMMQQHYLHNLLTTLIPFRRLYPFGLLRTHFAHIQQHEVQLSLFYRRGEHDRFTTETESLTTVLHELLPGAWNYRFQGRPRKSLCGEVARAATASAEDTPEAYINLRHIEAMGAIFEATEVPPLTGDDLPPDLPALPDTPVPIIRPVRLLLEPSSYQPAARLVDGLINDGDDVPGIGEEAVEAGEEGEGSSTTLAPCGTLPRAFPALWYRVPTPPAGRPVCGLGRPGEPHPRPHAFPTSARVLFEEVTFSDQLTVTCYAYAIDRNYSNFVPAPRIYYRRGTPALPVVIGDTLLKTDGMAFRLRREVIDAIVDGPAAGGPLRGEATLRALRLFFTRASGCGPFQADMLRKVIAMAWLDNGGTLTTLHAEAAADLLPELDRPRFDGIAARLIESAHPDPVELARSRERQQRWFNDAWPPLQRAIERRGELSPAFVRRVTRDLLVHTIASQTHDALARLVGAGDDEMAYFARSGQDDFHVFDFVEKGNGYSETAARFLHIPAMQRVALAGRVPLPTLDGLELLDENLQACPAHTVTRLLFEVCRRCTDEGIVLSRPVVPPELGVDLSARLGREFDATWGAAAVLMRLLGNPEHGRLLRSCPELLWTRIVPERFVPAARPACRTLADFQARLHLCVSGCVECVDNADGSIHGPTASREHVSRNLLDALVREVLSREPAAHTVLSPGTDRQAWLAGPGRERASVSAAPDAAPGHLLERQGNEWHARIPWLARRRDEREHQG